MQNVASTINKMAPKINKMAPNIKKLAPIQIVAPKINKISKTRMYWAVLGCTELHITGCARFYRALQSYTKLCRAVLGYNGLCLT